MIRFTWLQFRIQALVAIGALAAVAVVLALTGPHLVDLYNTTVAPCQAHGDCQAARSAFVANDAFLRSGLGSLLLFVPALIGIFWGAPLIARELETGTFRLAWTQSVTRKRWLLAKVGVIGLSSMAVAGLLSLTVTWWFSPLDRVNANRFSPAVFDVRDIAPIGYAAFAFALGVTAGALIRRTMPAIAITVVAFVGARLAMTHWLRPHLIAPAHLDLALNPTSTGYGSEGFLLLGSTSSTLLPATPNIPNAWITSTQIVDRDGHGLTTQFLASACPQLGNGGGPGGSSGTHHTGEVPAAAQQVLQNCVAKVGATYHELVTYQPASRYWDFQSLELAIYLSGALILAGFCLWWVRRRLS
jgi:hypothetical protein